MTFFDIFLYIGFILCGVVIGAPVMFVLGQRSMMTVKRRNGYGD